MAFLKRYCLSFINQALSNITVRGILQRGVLSGEGVGCAEYYIRNAVLLELSLGISIHFHINCVPSQFA